MDIASLLPSYVLRINMIRTLEAFVWQGRLRALLQRRCVVLRKPTLPLD